MLKHLSKKAKRQKQAAKNGGGKDKRTKNGSGKNPKK